MSGIKMNRKGIFFSLMAMMLSLLIISSAELLGESKASFEKAGAKATALKSTSSMLRSITSSLGNYEENEEINQRELPFNYSIRKNRANFISEIPLNKAMVDKFFDFINAYKIFLTDQDYKNAYSGYRIDLNVPSNSYWGGYEKGFSFSLAPLCIRYVIFDANNVGFGVGADCDFNENNIRAIDLNISIPSGVSHDFNKLECSLESYSGCPDNDYNALDGRLYFNLSIDDSACASCNMPQHRVRFHIESSATNYIAMSCSGNDCNSSTVYISLSPLPVVSNNGEYISTSFGISGINEIDELYFNDYNASVSALAYATRSEK